MEEVSAFGNVMVYGYYCPRLEDDSCSHTVQYSMHTISLLVFVEKVWRLTKGVG